MKKSFENISANDNESNLSSNVIINILNSPRKAKRLITLLVDAAFVFLSFWVALFIRLDSTSPLMNIQYWLILLAVLPISIVIFIRIGLYRAVLRYMSSKAVWAIVAGTLLSTSTLVLIAFFSTIAIPRTMPLIYAALILLSVGGARLLVRALIAQFAGTNKKPVVVYGAGSAGRQLANGLTAGPEYFASAFIDDDITKQKSIIQGIPVVDIFSLRSLIADGKVHKILLALPSATRSRRNQIISQLEHMSVKVQSIQGIKDEVEGTANGDEIVDVEIEDLLGREPVNPIPQLMANTSQAKT